MFLIPLILVIVCIFLIIWKKSIVGKGNENNFYDLYFLNATSNVLESEKREASATTDENKVIEVLQYLLVSGPLSQSLKTVVPVLQDANPIYNDLEINNGNVLIYFTNDYKKLSNVQQIFLKSSITWSLTSIPTIKNVVFYDGSKVIPIDEINNSVQYNRTNVLLNPRINPKDTVLAVLKLYFANKNFDALVPETRNIEMNPANIKESYIVNELIKGSENNSYKSLIPKGTKLLGIETDANNKICYVNLSTEFITKQSKDTIVRKLAVYSIVNSLTELNNVDSVQILIDSMKNDTFGKDVDLSNALTRNKLIAK